MGNKTEKHLVCLLCLQHTAFVVPNTHTLCERERGRDDTPKKISPTIIGVKLQKFLFFSPCRCCCCCTNKEWSSCVYCSCFKWFAMECFDPIRSTKQRKIHIYQLQGHCFAVQSDNLLPLKISSMFYVVIFLFFFFFIFFSGGFVVYSRQIIVSVIWVELIFMFCTWYSFVLWDWREKKSEQTRQTQRK